MLYRRPYRRALPHPLERAVSEGRQAEDWQSTIDIVLRRFAEYQDLEGAIGRRALTERAKGILMERHSVDERRAFDMLRDHARTTNRKLLDVATAVVDGHRLLPKNPSAAPGEAHS